MKITSAIVLFSISLCAGLCCPGEDDYNIPQVNIENNTVVAVQNNQNTFNVGETIVLETNIPIEQTTINNQEVLLSNYDYSEIDRSSYRYSIALYKQNEFGTVSKIPLTESNITEIESNTNIANGAISVEALYNGSTYVNTFSITLAEAGTYFLASESFLYNDNGQLEIYGGISEFAFVYIHSKIVSANTNCSYQFTVN